MDQKYHLLEHKYYAYETETAKDDKTFHVVKENIGRATTGKVHLMMHKKSGYLGIMKVIPSGRGGDTQGELHMLAVTRSSPFFIRLIDGFMSYVDRNSVYYIFLEFAPFKSLDHLTQALKGMGSPKAKFYTMEIASGIDFLHKKNIMHRDIKPENAFIRITGHVALGDLGLAMYVSKGYRSMCGTFLTRPPEVWEGGNYSLPVDVWMFGVSFYNIVSNKWPFAAPGKERQIQKVKEALLSFDGKFCESSSDLITKLLQAEPCSRPTIADVLKHKYFEDLVLPLVPSFSPQELLNIYTYDEDEKRIVTTLLSQVE